MFTEIREKQRLTKHHYDLSKVPPLTSEDIISHYFHKLSSSLHD